ncbi:MAG: hypothetical protein HY203_03870 [Nitrospirae bacterium]|nr:hypothetical protein [Nitrospirota bacterium]
MRAWVLGVAAVLLWPGLASAELSWVHGFLQGESAYRLIQPDQCPQTQRSACQDEFVRGGERFQLELTPRGDWWNFMGKAEVIHDAISGSVDVDLREGYLDVRFPALDLRLGRQIITWGIGDLIFITDVFPKDRVAFISGLPIEYMKKGSDAVNATAHWAGSSLQFVFIPHFEADTVPEAGGRLSFNDPMAAIEARRTDEPSPAIENTEAALRIFGNVLGWDLSLSAYRGFFHTPAAEVEPGPQLRFFYPRLSVYGASAQGAALGGVLSLEAGYYDSRQDQSGLNPAIENSSIRLLTGYQREIIPDLTLSGQYYVQVMDDHAEFLRTLGPGMPRRPLARHVLTLRLTQLLLHQTLKLSLFVLGSPNEGDFYVNPEVKYDVTDAVWVALGINLFGGPLATEFGQFEGNSNLYLMARYAF